MSIQSLNRILGIALSLMLVIPTMSAQYTLPQYIQGQYQVDTFYSYYGDFPSSGFGSIDFSPGFLQTMPTGMHFKMVIDSIDSIGTAGCSPNGSSSTFGVGDTLLLPVSCSSYNGSKLGFHIIIEGTPSLAGENYPCDVEYVFTLGADWGMLIMDNFGATCTVDQIQSIAPIEDHNSITLYPNPTSSVLNIQQKGLNIQHLSILNINGQVLQELQQTTKTIDVSTLSAGVYFILVQTDNNSFPVRFIKQ